MHSGSRLTWLLLARRSFSRPMLLLSSIATSVLTQHAHCDGPQVSTVCNGAHICWQADCILRGCPLNEADCTLCAGLHVCKSSRNQVVRQQALGLPGQKGDPAPEQDVVA